MSKKPPATANLRVTRATDVMVNRAVIELAVGDHLVPEGIADRVVAAGFGERLKPRGKRLALKDPDHGSGD